MDMDGVFADFVTAYYQLLEEKHPEAVASYPKPDELDTFYVDESVTDPTIDAKAIDDEIVDDPRIFAIIPPFEGAIKGMNRLRHLAALRGVEVFICTAPHRSNLACYSAKAKWINDYLGFDWLSNLHITRDKTMIAGTLLVDDKPDPLGSHRPTWTHVLMDRSYNRKLDKPRLTGWDDESLNWLINLAVSKHNETLS